MRIAIVFAILLALAAPLIAKEHNNLGGLHPDRLRVLSPDGQYELWNEDDFFVINPRGTDGSFFSDDLKELENSTEHTARYAIWNPDSRMIAICVETGKYIKDTFVLLRNDNDAWIYARLPYDDPDSQVVPLKWIDATTLLIEISGSYGGKSDHPIYFYTMTTKYDSQKGLFTKLSETEPHERQAQQDAAANP